MVLLVFYLYSFVWLILFKNEVGIISECLKKLNFNGIYLHPQSLN